MTDMTKRPLSRRDALKALAGITGAVAISSLPNKWSTPLVEVGALPAFAQCSPTGATAALRIINETQDVYEVTVTPSTGSISPSETRYRTTVDAEGEGCIEGIAPGEYEITYDTPDSGQAEGVPVPGMRTYDFEAGQLYTYTIHAY